jgi:hypothetical protein
MFGPTPGSKTKAGQSFARGTTMLFVQSAAPFGWTRVTTNDDALLRIVGTAAPGSGGSNGFVATFNSQSATGAFTLTSTQLPTLSANSVFENFGSGSSSGQAGGGGGATLLQAAPTISGGGGSHSHSITTSIKYVDALIAKKN